MFSEINSPPQYDLPTAITFLMAGLGIGSIIAILLTPHPPRPVLLQASTKQPNPP